MRAHIFLFLYLLVVEASDFENDMTIDANYLTSTDRRRIFISNDTPETKRLAKKIKILEQQEIESERAVGQASGSSENASGRQEIPETIQHDPTPNAIPTADSSLRDPIQQSEEGLAQQTFKQTNPDSIQAVGIQQANNESPNVSQKFMVGPSSVQNSSLPEPSVMNAPGSSIDGQLPPSTIPLASTGAVQPSDEIPSQLNGDVDSGMKTGTELNLPEVPPQTASSQQFLTLQQQQQQQQLIQQPQGQEQTDNFQQQGTQLSLQQQQLELEQQQQKQQRLGLESPPAGGQTTGGVAAAAHQRNVLGLAMPNHSPSSTAMGIISATTSALGLPADSKNGFIGTAPNFSSQQDTRKFPPNSQQQFQSTLNDAELPDANNQESNDPNHDSSNIPQSDSDSSVQQSISDDLDTLIQTLPTDSNTDAPATPESVKPGSATFRIRPRKQEQQTAAGNEPTPSDSMNPSQIPEQTIISQGPQGQGEELAAQHPSESLETDFPNQSHHPGTQDQSSDHNVPNNVEQTHDMPNHAVDGGVIQSNGQEIDHDKVTGSNIPQHHTNRESTQDLSNEQLAQSIVGNVPPSGPATVEFEEIEPSTPVESESCRGDVDCAVSSSDHAPPAPPPPPRPSPCSSWECVHIVQNNLLFGPYMLKHMFQRIGHTQQLVKLKVNGRFVLGNLYGPFKAKSKKYFRRRRSILLRHQ